MSDFSRDDPSSYLVRTTRARRPWTGSEDDLLQVAVEEATRDGSTPSNWNKIAESVPGRTNKDCRKRWFARFAVPVTRGAWSRDEDVRLMTGVDRYGLLWSRIATVVKTRNADQCAKRWTDALNPAIDHTPWRENEDKILFGSVEKHGRAWAHIVRTYLPHRTGLAAKNRYNQLMRPIQPLRAVSTSCLPAPDQHPASHGQLEAIHPARSASTAYTENSQEWDSYSSSSSPQSDHLEIKQEWSPSQLGTYEEGSPYLHPYQSSECRQPSSEPTPQREYAVTYSYGPSFPEISSLRGYASSPELKWSAQAPLYGASSSQATGQPVVYNSIATHQLAYPVYPVSSSRNPQPPGLQYSAGPTTGYVPQYATPTPWPGESTQEEGQQNMQRDSYSQVQSNELQPAHRRAFSQAPPRVAAGVPQSVYAWPPPASVSQPEVWVPQTRADSSQQYYQQQELPEQHVSIGETGSSCWYPVQGAQVPYSAARAR